MPWSECRLNSNSLGDEKDGLGWTRETLVL